jgi:glycosyltransferase involved in cell wall biosynthesis
MKEKKIGVILPIDYLSIKSGASQRMKADLAAIACYGFSTEVIFPAKNIKSEMDVPPGQTLITYPNFQRLPFLPEKIKLLCDTCTQFFNPFLRSVLRARYKRYSAILSHSPWGLLALDKRILAAVPVIYVAHDCEYERVRQVMRNPLVRALVYQIEKSACQKASRICCVSERDIESMRTNYALSETKLSLLPNTVDTNFLGETNKIYSPEKERGKLGLALSSFVLLFHGRMDYRPNLEALSFITRELAPATALSNCNFKLIVAGARIPGRYLKKRCEGVFFYSDVPDMRRFLSMADAVIVPLTTGGGTRIKILESFAAGVPVISTTKGIEGIVCRDGYHFLSAGMKAEEFVTQAERLAKEADLKKRLINNALNLVKEEYSIDAVSGRLRVILNEIEQR